MTAQIRKLISLNLALLMFIMAGFPVYAQEPVQQMVLEAEKQPREDVSASLDLLGSTSGYLISVDGTSFTSDKDQEGTGWKYSASGKKLELTDYTGKGIRASGDLTIYSFGEVAVTGSDGKNYGSDGICVDGNLTLRVRSGTFRVTGGAGNIQGGDGIYATGSFSCSAYSTAVNITGGQTYYAEDDGEPTWGGDAIEANRVTLNGDDIKITGGKGSMGIDAYGGCGIYAGTISIYADCTIAGGDAYCGAPGIWCRTKCSFGTVDALIMTGEGDYTEQIAQGTNMTVYITATRGVDITFQPVWGNLEDHDWQEWDELTRYGDGKDIPEAATFFLLAAFDEEETEDEAEPEDYIPGPTTPGLEVMMPQYGTLEGIAEHYSCSLIDILIYNELDFEDELEPGDELFLPYADEEAGDYEPTPPDIEHEVLEGETIESIAELYDISIEELIEYNELEPVEIEEEKPEEEPGAVEPGVPMEQPEWMEEQEEIEEIEEPEEPDINELYPLTPGDIILIPFEAASGYTPSDAVYEEDLPAVEPGTGEFVVIEPDSVLNSGSDEEQAQPDEEEEQPSYEEQLPQEEQQSSGILSVGGSLSPEQEENETTDEQQSDVSTEEEQPQQGGILSAGS